MKDSCGDSVSWLQWWFHKSTLVIQLHGTRQWQPTPVLLLGKSHGRRSLVGCSPWGHQESDTTEQLHFHFALSRIGEGNGNPLQCSCLENPRTGEPGGLPSMGSHKVGHDWSDLAAAASRHTGFPGGSVVKNLPANAEDVGLTPGSGRPPGGEHANPLQYFCLENPMDKGAWWATVHEVTESDTTEQLTLASSYVYIGLFLY